VNEPLPFSKIWLDCKRCPLHQTRKKVVLGTGNHRADVIIIGEGPGPTEDAQGTPFIGESGKLLNSILYKLQINRNDLFIDNVVACWPTMEKDGELTTRKPNKEEIEACRDRINEVIYRIDPIAIIAFGGTALSALTGINDKITSARKDIYRAIVPGFYKNIGYPLFPTFHPAFLLRNPIDRKNSAVNLFKNDLIEVFKLIDLMKKVMQEKL
jgi:uracil-DNA glycosylase family 4